MLRVEMGKALKSPFFWASVAIGCVIAAYSAVVVMQTYFTQAAAVASYEAETGIKYYTANYVYTPFGRWIALEHHTLGSAVFYFVFPLLATLPYGWSYCAERNSGYEKNCVVRSGRLSYHLSKLLAVFTSGGLAMAIPLAFSFLSLALFLPLNPPHVSELLYLGITPPHLFSMMFYAQPYMYVACFTLMGFVFCGLIACLCYTASLFVKNSVVVTLIPFALLVAVQYAFGYLTGIFPALSFNNASPMDFLNGQSASTTLGVVAAVAVALACLSFAAVLVARGRKYDVY
jgi:hypothetical protein